MPAETAALNEVGLALAVVFEARAAAAVARHLAATTSPYGWRQTAA